MTKVKHKLTDKITTQATTSKNLETKGKNNWIPITLIIACLVWIFSPIDPIPDLIAGLGQIDDILAICITVLSSVWAIKQKISSISNE